MFAQVASKVQFRAMRGHRVFYDLSQFTAMYIHMDMRKEVQ